MAQNSLFAVLLRSPWWISFLVALGFVAVTQALLPAEYRNLGSLGALPFFVIGVIAFWRQLRAPSPARAQELLASVAAMPWPQFEAALRRGFARQGWDVQPGRGGADLTLHRQGKTSLVCARRWKAARVGEEALQPLVASMRKEDAGGVYVALGEPSPQARRIAREAGIELLQQDALVKLLHGVVG
jgi:restriction system protein